jgi:hypothetical protein
VIAGYRGCVSSMAGTDSRDSLWVIGVHSLTIPDVELPKFEGEALKGSPDAELMLYRSHQSVRLAAC